MKLDFSHPHFADPGWLWLAGLGPVLLAGLLLWAERARGRQLARLAAPEFLADLLRGHSPVRRRLKEGLLVLAVLGLGLAMARPQWGREQEKSVSLGEDVVFLLDCSASMDSTDVRPTRLARAKLAVGDFAREYHNGRIGLVAFAGQAFLQCPLTFDFDAFQESLNAVDDTTIPVPGTDIGRALAEGYAAVEQNGRRKILILVSDGEDLEQGSIRRAKELVAQGVTIYTIGIGTPGGSEIELTDERGVRTPLKDEHGQVVVSKLDEATMKAIAEATHGTYSPLGPAGEGLDRVRTALSDTGGMHQFVSTRLAGRDHFQYPVAMGLVLLVAESLLGTRRARHKSAVPVMTLLSLGILLFSGATVRAADAEENVPAVRDLYNEGTQKLQAGKLHDAETSLNEAVPAEGEELQPRTLYNLGIVRFRAGKELLQGAPSPSVMRQAADSSLQAAGAAMKSADAALAGEDMQNLMEAYQFARLGNHNLRATQKALQGAMETYDKTLARWLRSWGDFKSATELQRDYTNADYNAEVVDKNITALRQQKQQLQAMQQQLAALRQALKGQMGKMRQKMGGSPGDQNPGGKGDDGDDDEDGKSGKGDGDQPPKNGPGADDNQKEGGSEQALTPEEAMRLLSSLHSDLTKKYSFGDDQKEPPKPANKRNW